MTLLFRFRLRLFILAAVSALALSVHSETKQTPEQHTPRRDYEDVCVHALTAKKVKSTAGTPTQVCACVGRNLETKIDPANFADIISISYKGGHKKSKIGDQDLDALLDFESSLAESCLNDVSYKIQED